MFSLLCFYQIIVSKQFIAFILPTDADKEYFVFEISLSFSGTTAISPQNKNHVTPLCVNCY